MLSKAMQDALNEQINNEFYSGYLYLAMAAHFEAQNLPGFAHWMRVQYGEEVSHGMKFFDHVFERGGSVTLKAIAAPPAKFKGPLEIFRQVLEHEQKVTKMIHTLYERALKEKDYASQVMLQWFIKEQVEEEKNDQEIIALLEMVGDVPAGMVMLDRQLGARKEG